MKEGEGEGMFAGRKREIRALKSKFQIYKKDYVVVCWGEPLTESLQSAGLCEAVLPPVVPTEKHTPKPLSDFSNDSLKCHRQIQLLLTLCKYQAGL